MSQPNKLCYFTVAILAFTVGPAATYAASPTGRFVVTGTGTTETVYDIKTKLTWQQAVSGSYQWAAAKTYCAAAATTLGGSGWRLPTIKELQTIVDYTYTKFSTYGLASEFQSGRVFQYWSATVLTPLLQSSPTTNAVWYLDAYVGGTSLQAPSSSYGVLCVR